MDAVIKLRIAQDVVLKMAGKIGGKKMGLIDANKLMLSLADWKLQETPILKDPTKPKEFTADDMQRMIWRTIRDCEIAVEEQPTVKAIPIEWIKKRFMDRNSSKWSYDWHVIADCLIAEWEKENECLISRQAAIDALRKAYWDKNIQSAKDDPCIVDAMTDWAIRQIKALPSAQPTETNALETLDCVSRQAERKNGQWINDKGLYRCSVCNNLWAHWWAAACTEGWMYKEMKFCPNCGAKMNEEKEHEEN